MEAHALLSCGHKTTGAHASADEGSGPLLAFALVATLILELALASRGQQLRSHTTSARPCDSQGLLLCHLLPPLQAAALLLSATSTHLLARERDFLLFQASVSCAALWLPAMQSLLTTMRDPAATKPVRQPTRWPLTQAAAACALTACIACTTMIVAPSPRWWFVLGGAAAAAHPVVFSGTLRHLPHTFTLGEAWLLSSAIVHACLWLFHFMLQGALDYHDAPLLIASGPCAKTTNAALATVARAACVALRLSLKIPALPVTVAVASVVACCVLATPLSVAGEWLQRRKRCRRQRGTHGALHTQAFNSCSNEDTGRLVPEDAASSGVSPEGSAAAAQRTQPCDDDAHQWPRARAPDGRATQHSATAIVGSADGRTATCSTDMVEGELKTHLPWWWWLAAGAAASGYLALMALAALAALLEILSSPFRCAVVIVWAAAVGAALPAMSAIQATRTLPRILLRKGFHALALVMFVPVLALDASLLSLALAVAFALMTVCELVRALGVPVIANLLSHFMYKFTDDRDGGRLTISHLSLVLGIAVPLWLSLEQTPLCPGAPFEKRGCARGGAGEVHFAAQPLPLAAWTGLLTLGVADSVAAAVGSTLGRTRVHATAHKSVEGTAAAALSLWACLAAAVVAGVARGQVATWRLPWVCFLSCLLEAVTTQLDNLVLPLLACLLCMVLLE
jgi:dolichol kinase